MHARERAAIMGYAKYAIEKLKEGKSVSICATGNLMTGIITSGFTVLIEPVAPNVKNRGGGFVLARVHGS